MSVVRRPRRTALPAGGRMVRQHPVLRYCTRRFSGGAGRSGTLDICPGSAMSWVEMMSSSYHMDAAFTVVARPVMYGKSQIFPTFQGPVTSASLLFGSVRL